MHLEHNSSTSISFRGDATEGFDTAFRQQNRIKKNETNVQKQNLQPQKLFEVVL